MWNSVSVAYDVLAYDRNSALDLPFDFVAGVKPTVLIGAVFFGTWGFGHFMPPSSTATLERRTRPSCCSTRTRIGERRVRIHLRRNPRQRKCPDCQGSCRRVRKPP